MRPGAIGPHGGDLAPGGVSDLFSPWRGVFFGMRYEEVVAALRAETERTGEPIGNGAEHGFAFPLEHLAAAHRVRESGFQILSPD